LPYWHDDVTLFEHALAAAPENPVAELHLGKDFADRNRYAEAVPHLSEAVRLQPDHAPAYYALGKAQTGVGDDASATRNFSEAVRLKPDYAEAYFARAALTVRTNPQAAETDLRAALKYGLVSGWDAQAHNALGVILGERGDLPAAAVEFQAAVRAQPEMVEAQRNLGQTLAAQGRIREAVARLSDALTATGDDPGLRQLLYSIASSGGSPPQPGAPRKRP
jgi:tetratricopeptide (TPR) repeat protein